MFWATEKAIGEVVIRRLGAKWFAGVLLFSFFVLYMLADSGLTENNHQAVFRQMATAISLISLLLITVIAATEIPYDISGRILLVVLAKPIRRYQYVAGKLLGIIAIGVIYALLCYLFAAGYLWFRGVTPTGEIVRLFIISALRVTAMAGMALFFSISSSEVPTIAGCLGGAILSFVLNIIAVMLLTSGLSPVWQILLSPLMYIVPSLLSLAPPPTVLGDLLTGTVSQTGSNNASFGLDDALALKVGNLGNALIYSLIYLFIFLALSVWTFRKSEKVE